MTAFKLSPLAKLDLKEIGRYTEKQWGKGRGTNIFLSLIGPGMEIEPHLTKKPSTKD